MRTLVYFSILLCISCNSSTKTEEKKEPAKVQEEPKKPAPPLQTATNITKEELETFGPIKLYKSYSEVLNVLGKPIWKSTPVLWQADGKMHEDWDYRSKGMVINMRSDAQNADQSRIIHSISAKAPCVYKTTRHIGIGSTYEEVRKAYAGSIDEASSDESLITAGTIYGGILFRFNKNKEVEQMYFGAAAE